MGQLEFVIQTREPVRLCDYLRRRMGLSARLLARLKRTPSGILCNGVPVRAVDPVHGGDRVVLTMPEGQGLDPNPSLQVPAVLETGRTHQIRVHFAYLGHPLAGDDLYGGSCQDIRQQALHCGRLFWRDPVTAQACSAVSPWRQDMQQLVPEVQLDWRNRNEEDRKL